ncbi:MAG: hypothetical protein ACODAD_01900 [Planctomycetota bacterium]
MSLRTTMLPAMTTAMGITVTAIGITVTAMPPMANTVAVSAAVMIATATLSHGRSRD